MPETEAEYDYANEDNFYLPYIVECANFRNVSPSLGHLKPLLFRGGVGVGPVGVAHGPRVPTPLRLGIKDAKSRCPSPKEEGRIDCNKL